MYYCNSVTSEWTPWYGPQGPAGADGVSGTSGTNGTSGYNDTSFYASEPPCSCTTGNTDCDTILFRDSQTDILFECRLSYQKWISPENNTIDGYNYQFVDGACAASTTPVVDTNCLITQAQAPYVPYGILVDYAWMYQTSGYNSYCSSTISTVAYPSAVFLTEAGNAYAYHTLFTAGVAVGYTLETAVTVDTIYTEGKGLLTGGIYHTCTSSLDNFGVGFVYHHVGPW